MDYDIIRPGKIIIRAFKYLGLWKLHGMSQKLYIFYTIFVYILVTITTASYIVNLILVDDLQVLFSCLYIFLTVFGCYMKMNNIMIFRRKCYFQFVSSMNDFDFKPNAESELQYYTKEYDSFGFTLKSYIVGPAGVLLLAYLTPLIVSEYVLPYPCWFPFDWKAQDKYWYAYGAVVCGMNHTCFVCVFLDLFHMFILCYVAVIYKVLIFRLEALGRGITKDIEIRELVKIMVFHKKVQKFVSILITFLFCNKSSFFQDG